MLLIAVNSEKWSNGIGVSADYYYLTFFNLPHPATAATATATATTATASRLRSQKLHIVLWGLHVGLVL